MQMKKHDGLLQEPEIDEISCFGFLWWNNLRSSAQHSRCEGTHMSPTNEFSCTLVPNVTWALDVVKSVRGRVNSQGITVCGTSTKKV
jgi:hypothetical protein